jgi:2Fe-2S ferredoxin
MALIHFADDDLTLEVAGETRLTDVCDEQSVSLLFGCREANCGTCLIEVLAGSDQLSPVTRHEQEMLEILAPDHPHARLACQCAVRGNVSVRALDL